MKINYLLLTAIVALSANDAMAQKLSDKVYYNGNYNVVKKASVATYYRVFNFKDKTEGNKPYRDYYMNDELKAEGSYSKIDLYEDSCHFVLDGLQTNYLKNGNKVSEINYKDDKKDGSFTKFNYKDGHLHTKTIGSYATDKPDGRWETHYMVDGQWVAVGYMNYLNGQLSGDYQKYDGDSLVVGVYKNDRLHGDYEVRNVKSLNLLAGGVENLPTRCRGSYFGGKKEFEWRYFTYPVDGGEWLTMAVVNYVRGKAEGDFVSFNNMSDTTVRDSIFAIGKFVDGRLEGAFERHDKEGRVVSSGNFTGGTKSGKWTYRFYDEQVYMVVNHDDHSQPIHFYTFDDQPFTGKHKELRRLRNDIDPNDISITVSNSVATDALFTNSKTGRFINLNQNTVMFHSMIYVYLFGEQK